MHTVRNRIAAKPKAASKAKRRPRKQDLPASAAPAIPLPALPPAFPEGLIVAPPLGAAIASVPWPKVELKRPDTSRTPAAKKTARAPRPAEPRASTPAAAQSPLPAPPPATQRQKTTKPATLKRTRSAPNRSASPGTLRTAPAAPAPLPRNRSLTRQRGGGLFAALGEFLRFTGLLPAPRKQAAKPPAQAEMARLRRENEALRRQLEALLALQSVGKA